MPTCPRQPIEPIILLGQRLDAGTRPYEGDTSLGNFLAHSSFDLLPEPAAGSPSRLWLAMTAWRWARG